MSNKKFVLSAAGLKRVVLTENDGSDNFRFIFGKEEVQMNRFLADFISPRVSRIHQVDPTIDHIYLNEMISENNEYMSIFQETEFHRKIKEISRGEEIEVDESMSNKLRLLSILLDNEELFSRMNELFPIEETNVNFDEIIRQLEYFDFNNKYYARFSAQLLFDIIAANFYRIEDEKLMKIPTAILETIIKSDKLKLESEDRLLEVINKKRRMTKGIKQVIGLYEQIEYDQLSEDKFNEFIEELKPDEISNILWERLKKCFYYRQIKSKNKGEKKERYLKFANNNVNNIEYDGKTENRFKGILRQLGNGNAKSAADHNIINITSSSCANGSYKPVHALDYEGDNYFFTAPSDKDGWLCIDFKDKKVKPSHYSIKSFARGGKNNYNVQTWQLEGKNEGDEWKILDDRTGDRSLDDTDASNTFAVQDKYKQNDFYQYLRIHQTGANTYSSGKHYQFVISSLEFFGLIKEHVEESDEESKEN